MTKRQRCDDPPWWPLLVDDVVSNGGFVHPDLKFLQANRTLAVTQKVLKGEVVLRIPTKKFMTKDRALSMCHPWLQDIITAEGSSFPWTNSTADIAIAIALAMASCGSSDSYLYLHSLPESSSFDALPRRWSEEDIRKLLCGTSLLRHVISAKTGAIEDYNNLLGRYRVYQIDADKKENTQLFPTFQKFSDMLAAVTSRAFQIGTTDEEIAIVPILDLGNHTRGKTTSKLGKKNVSYQYNVSEDAMIVRSMIDIDPGDSIRLTYGAKANAQLLLNYGFCIPQNVEPDGSSNDILEFQTQSEGETSSGKFISLRTGPKSYSYGGFVAALEEYFSTEKLTSIPGNGNENTDSSVERRQHNEIPNDFEDFLNECEDEEEGDGDFMGLYQGDNSWSGSAVEDDSNTKKDHQTEIEALQRFKLDLIKLSKGYNSTSTSIKSGIASSELYSMILSMSELRTIYFFVRVIDKVQHLLHLHTEEKTKSEYTILDVITDPKEFDMIDIQTDDLAKTFMSIRHGIF